MHECKPWQHPSNYIGATWEGFYSSGFGKSRDSDPLERSNFDAAWKAISAATKPGPDAPPAQIVTESHWAVGWVSWIAIHASDEAALKVARELCESANDYPSLDDDRLSGYEIDDAWEWWAVLSLKERVELCKLGGVSVFAARHDYLPSDENGKIVERLAWGH